MSNAPQIYVFRKIRMPLFFGFVQPNMPSPCESRRDSSPTTLGDNQCFGNYPSTFNRNYSSAALPAQLDSRDLQRVAREYCDARLAR